LSITSLIKKEKSPLLKNRERELKKNISNARFVLLSIISVIGFTIAIITNIVVPQKADVKMVDYEFGSSTISANLAYRFVLLGLILLYLGIGIFSWFREERREAFVKRVPFRFAIGIALALFDILGTKYQVLPQPFFPGPSQIIEAFLIESEDILQNTLYSLR
jgi:NitT/TauT family transport system permease protein